MSATEAKTGRIENTPAAWSRQAEIEDPYEAVRWSKIGQWERHKAVSAALHPWPGETLLDYGCGLGAFAKWMPSRVTYLGYDWAPGMIERAKREQPDRYFTDTEPQGSFDLTAVIGTFNLPSKGNAWDTLEALWEKTKRALAASVYAGDDSDCLFWYPDELVEFAEDLSARWTLKRHRANDLLLILER